MILRKTCIYCNNQKRIKKYRAEISTFISYYVLRNHNEKISIRYCQRCGGCFFDHAYDQEEIQRLYSEYRGDRYKQIRDRFEPGYSKINDLIGFDPQEIKSRTANLHRVLSIASPRNKVSSILDWGGDRGQLLSGFSKSNKYLYDVSDKQPYSDDIIKLQKVNENMKFDLVLSCHVLEHCAYPIEELLLLKRHVSDDGLLYLEVPYEYPKISRLFNILFNGKFYSSKFHEHINFFTVKSLETISGIAGLQIIYCDLPIVDTALGKMPVLTILFSKSKESIEYSLRKAFLKEFFFTFMELIHILLKELYNKKSWQKIFS